MKAITLNADWKCLGKSVKISSSFTMATICKNIHLNHHLLEWIYFKLIDFSSALIGSHFGQLPRTAQSGCQGLSFLTIAISIVSTN